LFVLQGCSGAAFGSKLLLLTPPNLAQFRPSCIAPDEVVISGTTAVFQAFGQLTSLRQVPEPGSLALLSVGLAGFAFF